MNENLDFLASRLFTIFFYLYNKKIGVKNIDRYLLAYLIYRGVEDMYGVYDLLNCLILDYTNCPKTAQFCVHNSPLVSPECSLRRYYFIQPIR